MSSLGEYLDKENLAKISALENPKVEAMLDKYIQLCKPDRVRVITDSDEDTEYINRLSLENNEEKTLKHKGHTIHFDSHLDQARDKENTKILLPEGKKIGKHVNTKEREAGLKEVLGFMDGAMKGKEMLVLFFTLGPRDSRFSINALQLTDSAYVAHSEMLLFRKGYEQFKKHKPDSFFHFVHSAGQLDENGKPVNLDKRRIYVDLEGNRTVSVNNQYGGNSIGLKKHALRLAINKANYEDWLCEHMFIMGAKPIGKDRTTYFAGAFPSACGKTSTAMIPGQSIVGDDIAYIRKHDNGKAHAVNVEQGIFGIIKDVNAKDDELIYNALTSPREVIFSNILIDDDTPYWLGMGKEIPQQGVNFVGDWKLGMKDAKGNEVLHAHKNARYTIRLNELDNADKNIENPEGVPLSGIIYGGRDSDTSVPVLQSLDWKHGVFIGAALESETTAATLGKEGVRKHNPMANLDFLVVPLGLYINNHLKFGSSLEKKPKIFSTNYFLKHEGKYLNEKTDKKVWMMWMEGRVHGDYEAIKTPIGYIPRYEDLKTIFKQVFDKDYTKEEYELQFSIRADNMLEKLDRIENIHKDESGIPENFFEEIEKQRSRLTEAKTRYGKGLISPFEFADSG